jgi:integrase
MKHNPVNERIKRKYLVFLKDSQGQSEPSVNSHAMAIDRFQDYTGFKDFKTFHFEQARAFKNRLTEQVSKTTSQKLSKATLHSTLAALKKFFQWLSRETGYKTHVNYSDAEYFNLSGGDVRIATAHRERPHPTLEQVRHVIDTMPNGTDLEHRDRAIVAFTLLTGARDSAVISFKLKHLDLEAGTVFQDAREVKTKNRKTFTTTFFPVGEEYRQIVVDWVTFLKRDNLFGNDDTLFPKTEHYRESGIRFGATRLGREHWSKAQPIRNIFKVAFTAAGLPYFNPHSIRKTLVQLAERRCPTPEAFKAWSQNLGHEKVSTTFSAYGEVAPERQGEIIRGLGKGRKAEGADVEEIAEAVVRKMKGLPPAIL